MRLEAIAGTALGAKGERVPRPCCQIPLIGTGEHQRTRHSACLGAEHTEQQVPRPDLTLPSGGLERTLQSKLAGGTHARPAGWVLAGPREPTRWHYSARPDIIVMEVVLDDRDGIDVARLIRARDPEVQLILLTGTESPNAPLNLKLGGLYVAAFLWKADGASWVVEAVGRASR
jgi:CheY-like chemotaxis protein